MDWKEQTGPSKLGDADPDAEEDERGAERGGRGAGVLAEERGGDGGGGEGGGVGDGHGDGDGRVAEEAERLARNGAEYCHVRRRSAHRRTAPEPAGREPARRSQTSAPRRISALVAPHTSPTATMLAASPPNAAVVVAILAHSDAMDLGLDAR